MKIKQQFILLFLLASASYLTHIMKMMLTGTTNFLYDIFGKLILNTFSNITIQTSVILVMIEFSDVLIATGVGVIIGFMAKRNAYIYSFTVISGTYIINTIYILKGEFYFDRLEFILFEIIMIILNIIFVIIGTAIGKMIRNKTKWRRQRTEVSLP